MQEQPIPQKNQEISLLDIIIFIQEAWKKLAIAAIVGAALGMSSWLILGNYSADYILLNNNSNVSNSYALDLVSWKMLQKSLPNLADQIFDEGKAPDGQSSLYKKMSDDQWWQKNVIPSYAISKVDAKDLAVISKDLDAASTTIISFTLTATGRSKQQSIDNVRAAAKFLRTGSAYLQLYSLLNGYESQIMSAAADVQQKITKTQIEMDYQKERIRQLEELHKRFPGINISAQQGIEAKDSNAKYLPLQTQIIAGNSDINASKELLSRLQRRLGEIAITKEFLQAALPLLDQTFDGLVLSQQLLDIEGALRKNLAKDDTNGEQLLNNLHTQLLDIQVRFTKGLNSNTAPNSSGKMKMMEATIGGLSATFFLMLLLLLGKKVWVSAKSGSVRRNYL